MSSCPFTSAFHCSFGLNRDAPGYTCTSRSTLAALASRAMICTISSRTSPRPPGNWCEARRVVGAPRALALIAAPSALAIMACLMRVIQILLQGNFAGYPKLYDPGGAQPGDLVLVLAEAAQHLVRMLAQHRRPAAVLDGSLGKAHRASHRGQRS